MLTVSYSVGCTWEEWNILLPLFVTFHPSLRLAP